MTSGSEKPIKSFLARLFTLLRSKLNLSLATKSWIRIK